MARGSELQTLVSQFVSQLQQVISRDVQSEISGKFDAFRASVFSGAAPTARRAGPGRPPKAAVAVVAAKGARRSPLAGREAEQKPCPICGKLNKARRFSYLCDDHRTPENREKFKGTAKTGTAPAAAAPAPVSAKKTAAAPAKAAKSATKRGPGRPKGSKNKKKAAAGKSAASGKTEASAT